MIIQNLVKKLIEIGIEKNEAKKEVKMLLEHFCNYTDKDLLLGKDLSNENIKIIEEKLALRIQKRSRPI